MGTLIKVALGVLTVTAGIGGYVIYQQHVILNVLVQQQQPEPVVIREVQVPVPVRHKPHPGMESLSRVELPSH